LAVQTSGCIVAVLLAAPLPATAFTGADPPGPFGLQLDSPAPEQRVRLAAPVVEVSGRATAADLYASDIVIAIDSSNSALLAAGVDVDGDGSVGTTHRWAKNGNGRGKWYRRWTTDPDDTILQSELYAARFLTTGLATRKNRIGVMTYTGRPRVRVEVGPPEAAIDAVERIRIVEDWSGTDIARALEKAAQMLDSAPPVRGPDRPRIVLLFSDGEPTVPSGKYWASRGALHKAAELAERQIRVCTFAFGEDADMEFLSQLARLTQCRLIPFEEPQDLILDRVSDPLEPLRLTIVNLTTGKPARAVRILPDGAFDGFAMLVPGENRIEVSATLADGRHVTAVRTVHYEPAETETQQDRRDAARMLIELRRRTREIEAAGADRPNRGPGGGPENAGSDRESP
jgi:hypothetical protein